MKRIIGLLLIGTISSGAFAQSPWVKEKGKGYAQISYNVISDYSTLFLASGESLELPRSVIDKSIQLYGEYGIGNGWQVSAALPYKLLETGELSTDYTGGVFNIEKGTYNAFGNIGLAVKKNLINKSFLLSGQLQAELPSGSLDEPTGLRSGLDALSIIPSITVGKGWSKMYGYLSLGSAIRSNDYSSDIRLSGEFGTQPVNKLWIVLVLDVVSSFENGDVVADAKQLQSGLYLNNQEYFAYGLKFAYEIKNGWGINLAGYGASSGNLVAKAPSLNLGVYYEW